MAKEQQLSIPTSFKIGDAEVNKTMLEAKIAEDTEFNIMGVTDTAGYKSAIAKRALYRTTRTTIAKVVKEMSQPHKDYVAGLKKAADELGAIAYKGEQFFDEQITAIDDEKERLRQEKEAQEQSRIQGRINELMSFGAKFDGENYYLPFAEGIVVSPTQVKSFAVQAWGDTVIDFECAYNKEQERIANELLAQQQQELAERLEREQQENDRLEQQAELDRQKEANDLAAKNLLEKRTLLRRKEMSLMGIDYGAFDSIIETATDDEWDKSVTNYKIADDRSLVAVMGEDNICPLTQQACDDEACTPGSECNVSGSSIASGNPVSDPQQGYVANETQEDTEPRDYSLNDFESLTRAHFTGSKAHKKIILDAVASYKEAMDKF